MVPADVLSHFGFSSRARWQSIGSGHIHQTFLVEAEKKHVLQRVNKNIFKQPEYIASNLRVAGDFLKKNYPDYLFLPPLPDPSGEEPWYAEDGFPWRVFPYIENTITLDEVSSESEAREAAAGFATLTRLLNNINCADFTPTLDKFHDLSWRYQQFEEARLGASEEVKKQAASEINLAQHYNMLVKECNDLIASGVLKLRITHNDTKINNILFDKTTRKAVCVIDLDTLMPGYFIYDLGDLVRTTVSTVNEEETDISRIDFRKNIYDALRDGYLSQMKEVMTEEEQRAIPFAGKMMTYIMAIRFLADFLRGNTYYTIKYPTQNLVRAKNQLALLEQLMRHT